MLYLSLAADGCAADGYPPKKPTTKQHLPNLHQANIRLMFDMLRTVIATEREQSKELGDAVAKGEHSAAQLRELQQKFGVAQVR